MEIKQTCEQTPNTVHRAGERCTAAAPPSLALWTGRRARPHGAETLGFVGYKHKTTRAKTSTTDHCQAPCIPLKHIKRI